MEESKNRTVRTRTPSWEGLFLDALARLGIVKHAAEEARVARRTVYSRREKSKRFAAQWADAIEEACDLLEFEARKRAIEGSDRLLEFLLKAHRPEKYRERHQVDFSGKVENSGVLRVPARLSIEEWLSAASRLSEYQEMMKREHEKTPTETGA